LPKQEPNMLKLSESQALEFGVEYIKEKRWLWIKKLIDQDFQNRPFQVLDVGGGNGVFADKILSAFPNAEVTVLDCSKSLLQKNIPHPRKKLVHESVENLQKIFCDVQFDLIIVNLVLHHLVGKTYKESRNNALQYLMLFKELLSEEGRLFICEHFYNGLLIDSLASRMIYYFTSIKLSPLRKLFHKYGANTAGIGVCFQSRKMWQKAIQKAGFHTLAYNEDPPYSLSFARYAALHIRSNTRGFFWLKREEDTQQNLKVA